MKREVSAADARSLRLWAMCTDLAAPLPKPENYPRCEHSPLNGGCMGYGMYFATQERLVSRLVEARVVSVCLWVGPFDVVVDLAPAQTTDSALSLHA